MAAWLARPWIEKAINSFYDKTESLPKVATAQIIKYIRLPSSEDYSAEAIISDKWMYAKAILTHQAIEIFHKRTSDEELSLKDISGGLVALNEYKIKPHIDYSGGVWEHLLIVNNFSFKGSQGSHPFGGDLINTANHLPFVVKLKSHYKLKHMVETLEPKQNPAECEKTYDVSDVTCASLKRHEFVVVPKDQEMLLDAIPEWNCSSRCSLQAEQSFSFRSTCEEYSRNDMQDLIIQCQQVPSFIDSQFTASGEGISMKLNSKPDSLRSNSQKPLRSLDHEKSCGNCQTQMTSIHQELVEYIPPINLLEQFELQPLRNLRSRRSAESEIVDELYDSDKRILDQENNTVSNDYSIVTDEQKEQLAGESHVTRNFSLQTGQEDQNSSSKMKVSKLRESTSLSEGSSSTGYTSDQSHSILQDVSLSDLGPGLFNPVYTSTAKRDVTQISNKQTKDEIGQKLQKPVSFGGILVMEGEGDSDDSIVYCTQSKFEPSSLTDPLQLNIGSLPPSVEKESYRMHSINKETIHCTINVESGLNEGAFSLDCNEIVSSCTFDADKNEIVMSSEESQELNCNQYSPVALTLNNIVRSIEAYEQDPSDSKVLHILESSDLSPQKCGKDSLSILDNTSIIDREKNLVQKTKGADFFFAVSLTDSRLGHLVTPNSGLSISKPPSDSKVLHVRDSSDLSPQRCGKDSPGILDNTSIIDREENLVQKTKGADVTFAVSLSDSQLGNLVTPNSDLSMRAPLKYNSIKDDADDNSTNSRNCMKQVGESQNDVDKLSREEIFPRPIQLIWSPPHLKSVVNNEPMQHSGQNNVALAVMLPNETMEFSYDDEVSACAVNVERLISNLDNNLGGDNCTNSSSPSKLNPVSLDNDDGVLENIHRKSFDSSSSTTSYSSASQPQKHPQKGSRKELKEKDLNKVQPASSSNIRGLYATEESSADVNSANKKPHFAVAEEEKENSPDEACVNAEKDPVKTIDIIKTGQFCSQSIILQHEERNASPLKAFQTSDRGLVDASAMDSAGRLVHRGKEVSSGTKRKRSQEDSGSLKKTNGDNVDAEIISNHFIYSRHEPLILDETCSDETSSQDSHCNSPSSPVLIPSPQGQRSEKQDDTNVSPWPTSIPKIGSSKGKEKPSKLSLESNTRSESGVATSSESDDDSFCWFTAKRL